MEDFTSELKIKKVKHILFRLRSTWRSECFEAFDSPIRR